MAPFYPLSSLLLLKMLGWLFVLVFSVATCKLPGASVSFWVKWCEGGYTIYTGLCLISYINFIVVIKSRIREFIVRSVYAIRENFTHDF